ncbi:MAG: RidA family protein [Pseudomonadales bacterium]|jgi:2-iminobutanoate/2-iminopropanoate deaminase|nr:RidA family protein [Pseudomonadales bacterium]
MSRKVIGQPMEIAGRPLPLSQGIAAHGFLFASGQLGVDAERKLAGPDAASQTRQALENLKGVLAAGGCGLEDVVKVTSFLTDASHAADYNRVYAEYFPDAPPARSTVISGLLLAGAVVEIEAIAAIPG